MTTTPPYEDALFEDGPLGGQIHVVPLLPDRYRATGEHGAVHVYERIPLGDRQAEGAQRGFAAIFRFTHTEQVPGIAMTLGELRHIVKATDAAGWPDTAQVHVGDDPVAPGTLKVRNSWDPTAGDASIIPKEPR